MARLQKADEEFEPDGTAERAGLDQLYRRYSGWLGGLLRRQLGPERQVAEDLVQETWIRASRYDVTAPGHHPKALLKQIAVNLARDHMRRNVIRGGRPVEGEAASDALARLATPADQEAELMLKQLVLGLPRKLRDVFLLSRFTGMTYDEIAHHLGISVKAVEWRMSKALARLAAQVRD